MKLKAKMPSWLEHWSPLQQTAAAAALAVAALAPFSAAASDEIVFGSYDEFTLFTPGGAEGLSNDILFVFHGFGSAMPNGAYKRLNEIASEDFTVVGFNYDYFDLDANDAAMSLIWSEILKDRNVVFAGTSLGGFWANHYAEKYEVDRVILVNPVVDPADQLRQFIGDHYIEKRQKNLTVTAEDVDAYIGRDAVADPDIKRLVILTRDDDILDFLLAEQKFTGADDEVFVFDEGGHTLNLGEERFAELLRKFLGN